MNEFIAGLESYIQSAPILAFVAVFLGGVLTSFTPCVYPLIPVTIGIIGTTGDARGARSRGLILSVVYVLGIATMYAALGAFAALTGRLFGEVGSSPWSYFALGNVCILLALVLFDVIPFKLPGFMGSLQSKTSTRKGFVGVYLLGILSGLILGPCTAAPLGIILAFVATQQNVVYGMSLLFTFAVGMGILLIIVGAFAGVLSALPRPGIWMDRAKQAFAWFLLLTGEILFIRAGMLF